MRPRTTHPSAAPAGTAPPAPAASARGAASHGTLREEIRQTRPFRSMAQEATLGLFRTADLLRKRVAEVIEPSGVTQQQYNVLRILRGAGKEGLPTLAIADRMIERAPGITRLIDRLVKKGLVKRERLAGDRRCVQCRITEDGAVLLASLDGTVDDVDEQLLGMLSGGDQARLIELLDQIREGLRPEALGREEE
ncbi:MAG: MarR family transcriptional regulator [Holophagales bacterium]|nr:MarR family transcriptional regulator [Holophagales bacterium]